MNRREELATKLLEIQQLVCTALNISRNELVSERRSRKITPIRFVAYWLCRKLTKASYPEIAIAFNYRHHTTIMHGIDQAPDCMKRNKELGEMVRLIMEAWKE